MAPPEPLRVLVLTPDFPPAPGGIQILSDRLVRHAPSLRSRVVTLRSPGWEEFDRESALDVRRAPDLAGGRAGKLLLNGWALREALAFRPQAVLSAHIVTSPAARVIQRAAGVPFAQYLHADEVRARARLAAFAVGHADAVVAVSRYTEELAVEAGARRSKVRRIPNGVDPPSRPRAERAAEPTLLTVARLNERYKGFDVIARALPLIRSQVDGARWVVAGDGQLRGHVEALVRAQGLDGSVRFVGEVSNAERDAWFDRAHVFVMPSRLPASGSGGEGFGIAYLEAAARGLPVVAGNVAGAPDAVAHGKTGVLVDPTDHVSLADAVTDLLLDRHKAEAMGRAGAERTREFAWPVIAGRVEGVLRELAGSLNAR
jgi:phosphatidyl-myo-inositol dimannoside synthase